MGLDNLQPPPFQCSFFYFWGIFVGWETLRHFFAVLLGFDDPTHQERQTLPPAPSLNPNRQPLKEN